MGKDTAIQVTGLGKKYIIGHKKEGDLRNAFGAQWRRIFTNGNGSDNSREEFWALKDVSFKVKQGEAVGIIGRNGAGKSTLLKILSRITEPTTGRVVINGRVSSLLEVGTGFHMELTGRENIFLNGTILGMKRREVRAKFDEIVAFSGVEKFIDTPVKHYSSGMKVRLAFAVAAHLDPEILLIDEVLAVGDAEFQKKCLGKMDDVTRKEGRTVLFVSHNMGAIKKICDTSILLSEGEMIHYDQAAKVIERYLSEFVSPLKNMKCYETEELKLSKIRLYDNKSKIRNEYTNLEPIFLSFELYAYKEVKKYKVGILVENSKGDEVLTTYHNDKINIFDSCLKTGSYKVMCELPKDTFNKGQYYVSIFIGIHMERWIIRAEKIQEFNINYSIANPDFSANERTSIIAPMLNWIIEENES